MSIQTFFFDGFDPPCRWDLDGPFGLDIPYVSSTGGRNGGYALVFTGSWGWAQRDFDDEIEKLSFNVCVNPSAGMFSTAFGLLRVWGKCTICDPPEWRLMGGLRMNATHHLEWWSGEPFNYDWVYPFEQLLPIHSNAYTNIEVHIYGFAQSSWVRVILLNATGVYHYDQAVPCETNGYHAFGTHAPNKACAVTIGGNGTYMRTDFPGAVYVDDAALNMISGSGHNEPPLGDVQNRVFRPYVDGYTQGWTPSDAYAENCEMVDETVQDSDDTYIYGGEGAVGIEDRYWFDVGAVAGSVVGVTVVWMIRKTNVGFRQLRAVTSINDEDDYSLPFTVLSPWPLDAYHFYEATFPTDAEGNIWTAESLAEAQFGQEIYL